MFANGGRWYQISFNHYSVHHIGSGSSYLIFFQHLNNRSSSNNQLKSSVDHFSRFPLRFRVSLVSLFVQLVSDNVISSFNLVFAVGVSRIIFVAIYLNSFHESKLRQFDQRKSLLILQAKSAFGLETIAKFYQLTLEVGFDLFEPAIGGQTDKIGADQLLHSF